MSGVAFHVAERTPAMKLLDDAMYSAQGRRDPYPLLERLHEHGDAVMMPEGYLAVWGHQACSALMRSPDWGRRPPDPTLRAVWQHRLTTEQRAELRRAEPQDLAPWLQLIDGEAHLRQRRLVNRYFTPRRLELMRDRIREMMRDVLATLPTDRAIDFMSEVAYRLPEQVIGELVGLPVDDRQWFALQTRRQRAERDPAATFDELLGAVRARAELVTYMRGLVDERRRDPGTDLASDLIRAQEEGEQLREPELISLLMMMHMAGYGTTAQTLGNGLHALLSHPVAWASLRDDRSLLDPAIEEILRFDTIVITVDYCAQRNTSVAGIHVPVGTPAHLYLGAANRDPNVFEEPRAFDVTRMTQPSPPTIAFGTGPHHCLGSALARLEAHVAFDLLLDTFPEVALADPGPVRANAFTYRYFQSLPVLLGERAATQTDR